MTANELIIKDLFRRLKPVQQKMFTLFLSNNKSRKYIIHCSRRLGKTFLLCVLAITVALSKANAQIRYASVTGKAVRKMIKPIFKKIFMNYKRQYRPSWNSQEGAYLFANGSMIHVAGVNNGHEDDLRGTDADLAIVDEAGFVDNLEYLTESVLVPQLINTGGMLAMASSSPLSPAHEFAEYIHAAKSGGYYASFDIHQSGYESDVIAEFCNEAGGSETTTWKREYLNELIVDTEFAIVPEFTRYDYKLRVDQKNFEHFHKYVSMDLGVRDLTVALFGYYDFPRAKLCIQKEFVMSGPTMTTPKLFQGISGIEKELWNSTEPYKRIADNNNPLLLLDLNSEHGMFFGATSKDTLNAMVNQMRVWFASGRIEIDESCTTLIESLKYGVWNHTRSDFDRSKTLGHFDAVAALMYLVRNIDETTNPIPVKVGFDQVYFGQEDNKEVFKNLIKRR